MKLKKRDQLNTKLSIFLFFKNKEQRQKGKL